jgi:hypothetical protein
LDIFYSSFGRKAAEKGWLATAVSRYSMADVDRVADLFLVMKLSRIVNEKGFSLKI